MLRIRFAFSAMAVVFSLYTALPAQADTTDVERFEAWKQRFYTQALQQGIAKETLDATVPSLTFIEKVIRFDRAQPDQKATFKKYLQNIVPASRIKLAREKYKEHRTLLNEIGKKYGVQPRFIVALWAIESNFGRHMGNYRVVDSLATLAFEGRRAEFFTDELIKALQVIEQEHRVTGAITGSWAGAMGQTQFMPSSYLQMAVDYNKDGKRDIWGTQADVFASIANYLATTGWNSQWTWGREVQLPKNFPTNLLGRETTKTMDEWRKLGVKRLGNRDLPAVALNASIVIPGGDQGETRAFMVYDNYKTIMKWNRSLYFATAVGILSDGIGDM